MIRALHRGSERWMRLLVPVCCVLFIMQASAARGRELNRSGANAEEQNSRAATPDSQFAIGDFDGDRQLDLASVQIGGFNPQHSRYWISLRLSKGGLQTMGVTGPAGGLALLARDVNGDRALDLVLVTAWGHEFVAVLLNDGQGNFSAADPRQVPIERLSSATQVKTVPGVREDRTVLSFPNPALRQPSRNIPAAREWEPTYSLARRFAVKLHRSSFASRAPPAPVFHV